jgi:hypothetical protein
VLSALQRAASPGRYAWVGAAHVAGGSAGVILQMPLHMSIDGRGDGSFGESRSFTVPRNIHSTTIFEGKLVFGAYEGNFIVPSSCL